jgi:hypothetical protein
LSPCCCGFAPLSFPAYREVLTIEAVKNPIAALPIEEQHSPVSWLNELE